MPERYYVDGQKVDVADEKLDAFLQKYPKAQRGILYTSDEKDLYVPEDMQGLFKQKYPNALIREPKTEPIKNPEEDFQSFYSEISGAKYLNQNPDDPKNMYDYRGYYDKYRWNEEEMARIREPNAHFPSEFKDDYHPNRVVPQEDGTYLDTKNGTAMSEKDYLGWDRARRMKEDAVFNNIETEQAAAESTFVPPKSPRLSKEEIRANILAKDEAEISIKEWGKGLYQGAVSGTAWFWKGVSQIPTAVAEMAYLPQNLLSLVPENADILEAMSVLPGNSWLKPLAVTGRANPELFKNMERHAPKVLTTGNKMYQLYDNIQKSAQAEMVQFDNSIGGDIKEGNYMRALAQTSQSIAEAIPMQLAIMASAYAGVPLPAIMGTVSTMSAGDKFTELSADEENRQKEQRSRTHGEPTDIKQQKMIDGLNEQLAEHYGTYDDTSMITKQINAIIHGGAEGVFETLGTGRLGQMYGAFVKRFGSKTGGLAFNKAFGKSFVRSLKNKGVILTDRVIEGVEELATQVTQNLNDIYTGVNKELNAWSGSFDAFAVGLGASSVTTLPMQMYTRSVQKKVEKRIDTNIDDTIKEVRAAADKEVEQAIKFIEEGKHVVSEKEIAELDLRNRENTENTIQQLETLRETLKSGKVEGAGNLVLADNIVIPDNITVEQIDQLKAEMQTEEGKAGLENTKNIPDPTLRQLNAQLWVLQDKRSQFDYGTPEWVAITRDLGTISEQTQDRITLIQKDIDTAVKDAVKHFENLDTADEQIYELSSLVRTLQSDIDDGTITWLDAMQKIEEHGFDPIKMTPEQFQILGSNEKAMIGNASKDLIKVLGGANPLTVVEERVEAFYNNEGIHDADWDTKVGQWKTEYEASIGDIINKSNKEWFSTLARRYAAGVEPKGKIHKELRKILDKVRNYFSLMFGDAQTFARLVKEGKINEELVDYLDRSVNEPTAKRTKRIAQMLNPQTTKSKTKPKTKPKKKSKPLVDFNGKKIQVGDKVLINNVNPIVVEEITDTYIAAKGKSGKIEKYKLTNVLELIEDKAEPKAKKKFVKAKPKDKKGAKTTPSKKVSKPKKVTPKKQQAKGKKKKAVKISDLWIGYPNPAKFTEHKSPTWKKKGFEQFKVAGKTYNIQLVKGKNTLTTNVYDADGSILLKTIFREKTLGKEKYWEAEEDAVMTEKFISLESDKNRIAETIGFAEQHFLWSKGYKTDTSQPTEARMRQEISALKGSTTKLTGKKKTQADKWVAKEVAKLEATIEALDTKTKPIVNKPKAQNTKTVKKQQQDLTENKRKKHKKSLPITEQDQLSLEQDAIAESNALISDEDLLNTFVDRTDNPVERNDKGQRVVKDYDMREVRHGIATNPKFKQFYKGSILIDELGDPVIMYHGTRNQGLHGNKFHTSPNVAGWITDESEYAMMYTGVHWSAIAALTEIDPHYKPPFTMHEYLSSSDIKGANILPLLVSIKNPIKFKVQAEEEIGNYKEFLSYMREAGVPEKMLTELEESFVRDYNLWLEDQTAVGKTDYDMSGWETSNSNHLFLAHSENRSLKIFSYVDQDIVGEIAKKYGYDSSYLNESGFNTYCVYKDNAIKSLYNTGEFSAKTPDISYDLVPTSEVVKKLDDRMKKRELERQAMEGIEESKEFRSQNRYQVRELAYLRNALISSKMLDLKDLTNTIDSLTTKEEREVIPFLIEQSGVPKVLNRPDLEKLYQQLKNDKEFNIIVDMARTHFDNIWKEMTEYHEDLTYEQKLNYVPHVWDVGRWKGKKHLAVTQWFQRTNPFLKKRYIGTLMEGITEHGLAPKELDINNLIMLHGRNTYRAMANAQFIEDVKEMNVEGVPLISELSKAPDNWVRMSHPALRRLVFGSAGKGKGTTMSTVDVAVHPDLKDALDVILEVHDSNALGRAYDMVSGVVKKTNLSLSLFHHIALAETGIAMMGVKQTAKIINPISLVYRGFIKKDNLAFTKLDLAKDGVIHGLQLGASADFPVQKIQQFLNNLVHKHKDHFFRGGVAKLMAGFNERWDHALWDWLHDGLKLYAYESQVAKIKKDVTGTDLVRAKREIAQLVNDTFGGQNFDILMLNPKVGKIQQSIRKPSGVKAAQRLLLSFDWQVSTIRQALSPAGIGAIYSDKANKRLRMKIGGAFWLRAFLYYGVGMNMLNAFFRRRDREENPEYYQQDSYGWKDDTMFRNVVGHKSHLFAGRYKDGTERYVRWGKQFRELFELFLSDFGGIVVGKPFLKKVGAKANPVLQKPIELFTGSTLSGFENYALKDAKGWAWTWQAAVTIAQTPLPFSTRNLIYPHKESYLLDVAMPSSKGATRRKLIDLYEYAIKGFGKHDSPEDIEHEIQSLNFTAIQNGIDPYPLFKAALGVIEAEAKSEMLLGKNTIEELEKELSKADSAIERSFIQKKINAKWKEYYKFQVGAQRIGAQLSLIERHKNTMQQMTGKFEDYEKDYNYEIVPDEDIQIKF